MDSTPALKVTNLVKTYHSKKRGKKEALRSIDLEVPQGSFFGLLGPNGAGKSTLINILAGTVNKTSGKAEICGYDLDKDKKLAKGSIGIVPQELILDPFFPVYEALEYTAGYYGIAKKDRKTSEIIEAVGLSDKARSPARSLSGGMRRRLLVAKALVHSPKVLILDEPTAGVDIELRTQLWEYIKILNKQGTTVLLTTHYLEEAQELCDNIAIINNGKIVANDSKKNLMKIIDRKKLTIISESKLDKLPEGLSKLDATLNDEGNVEISYQTSKTSIDEILAILSGTSIKIKDLSTEEVDLEEVFRHLTKSA